MSRAQNLRFTNTMILVLILVLTLSGVYGLFWTLAGWMFDLHRIAGWGLIALIPAKVAISARSLQRGLGRRVDRGLVILISLILAVIAFILVGLGLWWAWRLGPGELWLRQTAISWHWMLSLGFLLPFGFHVWRRWPRPRASDLVSRQGFLKLAGVTGLTVTGWWASELISALRIVSDQPRRFTGSRGAGIYLGNDFPITNSPGEGRQPVNLASWRLKLEGKGAAGKEFTYHQILELPLIEMEATLDCTLGWFTTQLWQGIRLPDLFELAEIELARSLVRLESVTGYAHFYTMREAQSILLATHVGGEPLGHWHGFPLRAVVPGRRGWFWVKWLGQIKLV